MTPRRPASDPRQALQALAPDDIDVEAARRRVIAEAHLNGLARRATTVWTICGHRHIRPRGATADIIADTWLVWTVPAGVEQRPGAPIASHRRIPPIVHSIRLDTITATREEQT